MSWKTENALYKDLFIYYDSASKETVNNLADTVFPAMTADLCCPTVPVDMPGRKHGIRGSILVIRAEPPKFIETTCVDGVERKVEGQRNYPFDELITHSEMRGMFEKAISHKDDTSPYGEVREAKGKKPYTPSHPGADALAEMCSKLGMNVQFHDPAEAMKKMFPGGM